MMLDGPDPFWCVSHSNKSLTPGNLCHAWAHLKPKVRFVMGVVSSLQGNVPTAMIFVSYNRYWVVGFVLVHARQRNTSNCRELANMFNLKTIALTSTADHLRLIVHLKRIMGGGGGGTRILEIFELGHSSMNQV